MIFLALATDYDGTLASQGRVSSSTVQALEALRNSGRKLLLISGRQLPELLDLFPEIHLFDRVVAENGALLYCPASRETRLLADPVPSTFPDLLRERGITNLQVGQSIVATWLPHECTVLGALRDLGLDRQIIFNKDAVMVLPSGIGKASGLTAALSELRISHHNTVAIGDAENDLPMLTQSQCGVAVANALDSVKEKAVFTTAADHGSGVEELIASLLHDDLVGRLAAIPQNGLLLGHAKVSREAVYLPSLGESILVAGPSGSGKSTAITGLLERMADAAYQLCILDPEGDYETFEPSINLGNPYYTPSAHEVCSLLGRMLSVTVNLLGTTLDTRPRVASEILRNLDDLRSTSGRPHWFVIDEAHHIFPSETLPGSNLLPAPPPTSLLITVHPSHIRTETLQSLSIVIAVGKEPHETIYEFCRSAAIDPPALEPVTLERGEVLLWFRHRAGSPTIVLVEAGKTEHKRHLRKYAEGDLGPGSFTFTGPENKLKLVAHNLNTFIRMAEGVDDETWFHHLNCGELSDWFRWIIKNEHLADEVRGLENNGQSADCTRQVTIKAIQRQYTLSA